MFLIRVLKSYQKWNVRNRNIRNGNIQNAESEMICTRKKSLSWESPNRKSKHPIQQMISSQESLKFKVNVLNHKVTSSKNRWNPNLSNTSQQNLIKWPLEGYGNVMKLHKANNRSHKLSESNIIQITYTIQILPTQVFTARLLATQARNVLESRRISWVEWLQSFYIQPETQPSLTVQNTPGRREDGCCYRKFLLLLNGNYDWHAMYSSLNCTEHLLFSETVLKSDTAYTIIRARVNLYNSSEPILGTKAFVPNQTNVIDLDIALRMSPLVARDQRRQNLLRPSFPPVVH